MMGKIYVDVTMILGAYHDQYILDIWGDNNFPFFFGTIFICLETVNFLIFSRKNGSYSGVNLVF